MLHRKGSSEVSPFCAACRPGIVIYPVSSEVSSSVPPDGMAFIRGRMSFTCRGTPSTLTVCGLTTCYRSFLELRRASITRRFDAYRVAQTVPVLCGGWWRGHWVDIPYPNLISVNPVCRCSQRWRIIFGRDVVPVYRFMNRAPRRSCNLLNTAVASFYDAVACRHIGTLKPQAHSPAGGKLPEIPTREHSVVVSKQFLRWAALKEYCFEVLNDVSGVLPR